MDLATPSVKRVRTTLGYGVLGTVGTALTAFALVNFIDPVQPVIYDLFYLRVGPSEATETAILAHFLLATLIALSLTIVAGDLLSDRGTNLPTLAWAIAALLSLIVLFLVVALAGIATFLTALLVLAIGLIGIPLTLRYRSEVRSGALPAFIGGIPVIILLLFLAGFGIGWGWGYIVTAEEVSPASVNETEAVTLDEIPEVRDDLFTGECETTTENRRQCMLQLRGYDHEVTATRFLAQHGVRCPYRNTDTGENDTVIAEHNDTYYRLTCSPHGD